MHMPEGRGEPRSGAGFRALLSMAATIAIASTIAVASCSKAEEARELVVYAYDSFVSDWGPGKAIKEGFEKKYGVSLKLVSKGDAAQVLSAAVLEKGAPRADVLLGMDDSMLDRAVAADVLEPYFSPAMASVPAALDFDGSHTLLPFDYGYFAIIWDSEKLENPPSSLADLAKPEYAKKLILMDPRTSTPGLGFLAWTLAAYESGWKDYWKAISPATLTVAAGWDAGYGLFTKGEAPLVLSYTTSPAYHAEVEKTGRYKALLFPEGHVRQIEAMGIAKGTARRGLAEKFIDYMLSEAAQSVLPTTQWMYPVLPSVKLPDSYAAAPMPTKTVAVDRATLDAALAEWPEVASR